MAFFETFSQRRARAERESQPELYSYDKLPQALVNQIVMIWNDAFNSAAWFLIGDTRFEADDAWGEFEEKIIRAYGLEDLYEPMGRHDHTHPQWRVEQFFKNTENNDYRLDIIELVFSILAKSNLPAAQRCIEELNFRFKQSSVGYQIVEGKLVRLDSTVAHEEMVKPALILLARKGFEKADEQYRAAHEHYRRDEFSQAISEAGRAFESALKAICAQKSWNYAPGDRVSELISLVVKEGLFPAWLEKGISAYVAMLKTGLPTTRNNAGSHGTAPDAAPVKAYLARYALHMSAANILMVVEAAESDQS